MALRKKIPSRPPEAVTLESFRRKADRVDQVDADEVPEMRKEDFQAAVRLREAMPDVAEAFKRGRGRPKSIHPKVRVSLRLDPEIVSLYRSTGKGWQIRIERTLKAGALSLAGARSLKKAHPESVGMMRSDTKVGSLKKPHRGSVVTSKSSSRLKRA